MTLLQDLADRAGAFLDAHRDATATGVLAAVSGGCDSSALAHVLARLRDDGALRGPLALGHVDHGIGPATAVAAERVAALAERLGLRCHTTRLALGAGPHSEARLREARYHALCASARAAGAGCIATAHHADDDVETVLFRLLRGTGPRGLRGIPARRSHGGVALLRPFLGERRAALRDALEAAGEDWFEDPTNADPHFARNRLRRRTLPALRRELGGAVDSTVARLVRAARATVDLLEHRAAAICRADVRRVAGWRVELRTGAVVTEPTPVFEEVVRGIVASLLPAGATVPWCTVQRGVALAAQAAGARVAGPGQPLIERTRDGLLFVDPRGAGEPPAAAVELRADGAGIRFGTTEWVCRAQRCRAAPAEGDDPRGARIDAGAPAPWRWRTRRDGDRFQPIGMPGPVALKRVLQSRHVPRFDRARLPLAVDADDRVLWVPGAGVSAHVRPRGSAARAIELRVETS